jgi:(S)-2-hydroxyglutarate dehydrogenase
MINKKIAVIGGGLVGLATAYTLLKRNPENKVTLLEKENGVAKHQSGHNSGVIHSGIYYKPGSLKAANCIRGRKLLIAFCEEHQISFEICGKLIVATSSDELAALERIAERGLAHGLNIKRLEAEEAKDFEPHVAALKALLVPEAGIVDYSCMAKVLAKLIQEHGGEVKLGFKVSKINNKSDSILISSNEECLEFDYLINCAGLYSDKIALLAGAKISHRIIPFRGEYYQLKKERESLCKNLIYPVPDLKFPFLGVHYTRMIAGGVECGPNAVLALAKEGYSWSSINLVEFIESISFPGFLKFAKQHWKMGISEVMRSVSKKRFADSLAKLIPEISIEDLEPGGSGVRAQALDVGGQLVDDFAFAASERALHVLNAPSPAATSCLSLGEEIVRKAFGE